MKWIGKKGRTATVWVLLIVAAFLAQASHVLALNTKNLRWLDRGLLWTGFRNQGTQGGVLGRYDSRSTARMAYPGMGAGAALWAWLSSAWGVPLPVQPPVPYVETEKVQGP